MKALLAVFACLCLNSYTTRAAEPVPLTETELIAAAPPGSKPAVVMMGEILQNGKFLPAAKDKPLNARFETKLFLLVSHLDGLLADACDPSEPYWKAWRLVAEADKDGKIALEKARIEVQSAQQKVEALGKQLADPATPPDQVKALEIEVRRQQLLANEAQKALTTLTTQIAEAKALMKRGHKDLTVNFRLRLGSDTFGKLQPLDAAKLLDTTKSLYLLQFSLYDTNKDNEVWLKLLKNSPITSVSCEVKLAYINSANVESLLPSLTPFHIRIPLFRWPFWTSFGIIGACLFVFVRNIRTSELLRDKGIVLINRDPALATNYWFKYEHPLSMSRLQMSIWFFLIIGSFVFLWSTTGSLAGVNSTALALMGISGGTTMFSALISQRQEWDAKKRAPQSAYPSQVSNWFVDLLSDDSGITIHRFQMLAWTLVLSVVFVNGVITDYAMPVFTQELLGLMGISSGVYVGFKLKEGNPREEAVAPAAPPVESEVAPAPAARR